MNSVLWIASSFFFLLAFACILAGMVGMLESAAPKSERTAILQGLDVLLACGSFRLVKNTVQNWRHRGIERRYILSGFAYLGLASLLALLAATVFP